MFELKRKLWDHQRVAFEKFKVSPEAALFFEVGTGKTLTAIAMMLEWYRRHNRIMRTLVICPIVVCENWRRELNEACDDLPIDVLVGTKQKRLDIMSRYDKKRHGILITNYEALGISDVFTKILNWNPELIICDESSKVKNHKAVRTKRTQTLSEGAKVKYILTGTPVLNTPMDLFAQFLVLDGGATFGKNFLVFRARYFYDKNSGMPPHRHFPKWEPRPGINQEFGRLISAKSMRVKKSECLDLPPLVRQRINVTMDPGQSRAYDSMKKDFIAFLGERACSAQLAITKGLRLQQIVSGYVQLDGQAEPTYFKSNPRLVALTDLLESILPDHKVIVWASFRENYKMIAAELEKLKVKYRLLVGGISDMKRQEAIDDFQFSDRVRVLIANPGSGGIGINLTAASYAIYYSRNFSLEHDLQSEARCYRGGSEVHEKITRIDLVTPDSIDELILEALEKKEAIGEKILSWKEKI